MTLLVVEGKPALGREPAYGDEAGMVAVGPSGLLARSALSAVSGPCTAEEALTPAALGHRLGPVPQPCALAWGP